MLKLSIKFKIIIPFVILFFLSSLTIVSLSIWLLCNDFNSEFKNNAQALSLNIETVIETSLYLGITDRIQTLLDSAINSSREIEYITVLNSENLCIASTDKKQIKQVIKDIVFKNSDNPLTIIFKKNPQLKNTIETNQQVYYKKQKAGILKIGFTNKYNIQTIKKITLLIIITSLLALITGIIIFYIIIKHYVLNSLSLIVKSIKEVSAGNLSDLSTDINLSRHDEIGEVCKSLKKMKSTIQMIVSQSNTIASNIVKGDLSFRGNTELFEGDFQKVIFSLNEALDAITNPFNKALGILNKLGNGNLTDSFDGAYQGKFSELQNAMNLTLSRLKLTLNKIHRASDSISTGGKQLALHSQNLSKSSTLTASSLQEIFSSMQIIKEKIKNNAVHCNTAKQLTEDSWINASEGNLKMKEMIKSMEAISSSNEGISKIIKIINDIAFQTNLLSLNAAVEAASAGKYGKGFSVVAEEVRNLANRSAKAADEIFNMIQDSIDKIAIGTKIAQETDKVLIQIVNTVKKSSNLVEEITYASDKQAKNIQEITQNLEGISNTTQTNSATAEESEAASESFMNQADQLKAILDQFQLK